MHDFDATLIHTLDLTLSRLGFFCRVEGCVAMKLLQIACQMIVRCDMSGALPHHYYVLKVVTHNYKKKIPNLLLS